MTRMQKKEVQRKVIQILQQASPKPLNTGQLWERLGPYPTRPEYKAFQRLIREMREQGLIEERTEKKSYRGGRKKYYTLFSGRDNVEEV